MRVSKNKRQAGGGCNGEKNNSSSNCSGDGSRWSGFNGFGEGKNAPM